jgi:hypothetical protein
MPYNMSYSGERKVYETYNGFSPYRAGAARIVIVTFDGEPDFYAVDEGAELSGVTEEINRKYRADYGREPEKIVYYIRTV